MCPTCPQCVPYSELACISATLSMGFQLANVKNSGYNFLGNWGTKGLIVLREFKQHSPLRDYPTFSLTVWIFVPFVSA